MMSSRAQFSICAGVLTLYIAKQCFGIFVRFQSVECEKEASSSGSNLDVQLFDLVWFWRLANSSFERGKGFACAVKLRSTIDLITQGG